MCRQKAQQRPPLQLRAAFEGLKACQTEWDRKTEAQRKECVRVETKASSGIIFMCLTPGRVVWLFVSSL